MFTSDPASPYSFDDPHMDPDKPVEAVSGSDSRKAVTGVGPD